MGSFTSMADPALRARQGLQVVCGPSRPVPRRNTPKPDEGSAGVRERIRAPQATLTAQEAPTTANRDAFAELVAMSSRQEKNRRQKVR